MVDLDVPPTRAPGVVGELRTWTTRHVVVALGAAALIASMIGLPTDVIPNPVFGRPVPVTWWSYPTLVVTALLGGLLAATYVGDRSPTPASLDDMDVPTRRGGIAGLLSFFAVGCPVCNKLNSPRYTHSERTWMSSSVRIRSMISAAISASARLSKKTSGDLRICWASANPSSARNSMINRLASSEIRPSISRGTQLDRTDEAIDPCDNYFNRDGCSVDEGFFGPYAATNPEEDFAEAFSAFVFRLEPHTEEQAARLA